MAKPFSKTVIHNTDAKLSKQVRQPLKTNQGIHKALTWRVVDIAVGAAVGVMSGVMFWVFDGLSYGLFPLMTLILPGSAALLHAAVGLELPVRFDHAGMAAFRIRMECGVGEVPDYGMSVRVGLSAVQGSDFSLNLQACQSGWHPMTAPYV
jgi:hypothetical protein